MYNFVKFKYLNDYTSPTGMFVQVLLLWFGRLHILHLMSLSFSCLDLNLVVLGFPALGLRVGLETTSFMTSSGIPKLSAVEMGCTTGS